MVAVNADVYAVGAEHDIEDGEFIAFKPSADSGASPTLNLGQLGSVTLKDALGNVPPAGWLIAGRVYMGVRVGDTLHVMDNRGMASVAATADGLTTGLIPANADWVAITSANAAHIVTLPAAASVKAGHKVRGWVGATGCELRTPAASGTKINAVDSDGTNQAALPATTLIECTFISATDGWILVAETELGARIAAIVPDAP